LLFPTWNALEASDVLLAVCCFLALLFPTWNVLEASDVLLAVFFFFRLLSLASSFLAAMAAALSSSAEKQRNYFKYMSRKQKTQI
jgi:hypothetical protein